MEYVVVTGWIAPGHVVKMAAAGLYFCSSLVKMHDMSYRSI